MPVTTAVSWQRFTFTSRMLSELGLNSGSLISERDLSRSLTSPPYSVLMKRPVCSARRVAYDQKNTRGGQPGRRSGRVLGPLHKLQRRRVHAVAKAGRGRTIVEDMPQVRSQRVQFTSSRTMPRL